MMLVDMRKLVIMLEQFRKEEMHEPPPALMDTVGAMAQEHRRLYDAVIKGCGDVYMHEDVEHG